MTIVRTTHVFPGGLKGLLNKARTRLFGYRVVETTVEHEDGTVSTYESKIRNCPSGRKALFNGEWDL